MTGAARGLAVLAVSAALGGPGAHESAAGWLGVVLPGHSVDVVTKLRGTVTSVRVDLGDAVAAGDVLATVDAPALRAELEMAEARLLAAEAEVAARVARVAERRRVLAQRVQAFQLFGRSEIEALRAELHIDEADLRLAEARAEEARTRRDEARRRRDDSRLRAPVAGTVARVGVAEGGQVAHGVVAFHVVDAEHVEIRFAVPEEELGPPAAGDTVLVHYASAVAPAVVTARSPLIETAAGCILFEARPLPGARAARPGAIVRVGRSVVRAGVIRESGRRAIADGRPVETASP